MTQEEMKIFASGKLAAFCDDNAVIEPPCHADKIYNIFYSYMHTGFSRNKETPLEKLRNDFPDIADEELLELIGYFKQAKDYFENVCCAYASKYQYVGIIITDETKEDIERVITACTKRYPWIKPEFIKDFLHGVVAMCNR